MPAQTRDQQVRTLVEGLALGVLANGAMAVTASKMDLEFAVSHALIHWPYSQAFPSLTNHLGPNYVWIGIRKSERRRRKLAAWRGGQWLQPYVLFDQWSVEDCAKLLDVRIPHEGWVELGRLFVNRLGQDNVHYQETQD